MFTLSNISIFSTKVYQSRRSGASVGPTSHSTSTGWPVAPTPCELLVPGPASRISTYLRYSRMFLNFVSLSQSRLLWSRTGEEPWHDSSGCRDAE